MKRLFYSLFILAASASVLPAAHPNVLFIFSDDHAYQAISAYGHGLNKTPNIDRLADEGMIFERCYVSNSICGPMRAVIQTGKYTHKNGFYHNNNKFDGTQQTFPKLLQKAGYQTAVIGKWHLGSHMAPQGYDYSEVLIGQGPYYNPPMLRDHDGDGVSERVEHVGYTTKVITDLTLKWLEEGRDPDQPFMLMYQHKAPHREWAPGPDYLTMYDDVTFPEPETLFDDYANRASPARNQDMSIEKTMTPRDLKLVPPGNLTPGQLNKWNAAYGPKNKAFEEARLEGKELVRWKYQRYIKDYLRCIASVDDQVGRVLKYLDDKGLAQNTIVIYCSDQGFYLGEHGWFDKRWIYEESLRTPFLIRWPGVIKPGSRNKTDIVSPIDFAETFLEIAGHDIPGDMQGRSLIPILRGKTPTDWRKSFYYRYYEDGGHGVPRHRGVVDGRYKLIHYYEEEIDEWELIDLQRDPNELRSFYNDPEYATIRTTLEKELERLEVELDIPDEDPPASYGGWGSKKPVPLSKEQKALVAAVENEQVFAIQSIKDKAPLKPNCVMKPFTVGAVVTPGDGVVLAQGGGGMGYTLYVKNGVPRFGIRKGGAYLEVKASSPLASAGKTLLTGVLDRDSKMHLLVNNESAASGRGQYLSGLPQDPLSLGEDRSSFVGQYKTTNPFSGTISDIRLYWGEVTEEERAAWAKH